jgi:hypothetical protein
MESPIDPLNIITATNTISYYSSGYVQNLTNHLWVCNDVLKNIYKYVNARVLQYNKVVDIFTSFFQSVIGKSLSFTNIYGVIANKQKAAAAATPPTKDITVWGDFGKLLKLLIMFDPVSASGFDPSHGRMVMTNANGLDK